MSATSTSTWTWSIYRCQITLMPVLVIVYLAAYEGRTFTQLGFLGFAFEQLDIEAVVVLAFGMASVSISLVALLLLIRAAWLKDKHPHTSWRFHMAGLATLILMEVALLVFEGGPWTLFAVRPTLLFISVLIALIPPLLVKNRVMRLLNY